MPVFPPRCNLAAKMLSALGVEGRLAGGAKNRIKTIKLRGEISQGLIGPLTLIDGLSESERAPEQITEFLGVTKYEPEIEQPTAHDARLVELPDGVGIYDIENSERFSAALAELSDLPVWVTEKLEGSHFAVAIVEGKEWVCQRRFALENIPDKPLHFFWEAATDERLIELARTFASETKAAHFVLRGEIIGPSIQSNIYRLEKRTVRFFDILVNHRYLSAQVVIDLFKQHKREELLVPTLSYGVTLREWLNGRSIKEASTGPSALHKTLREGIVIRPLLDRHNQEMGGRLILKQISPEYLAEG